MPHAQAKAHASASPANLALMLEAIEAFNIEGFSGTNLEADGFFHFTVEHDHEADAHAALEAYHPEWTTDLYSEEVDVANLGQSGVLRGIVSRAKSSQQGNGRPIESVLSGVTPGNPPTFWVQVTFVGSDWSNDPPT